MFFLKKGNNILKNSKRNFYELFRNGIIVTGVLYENK